MLIVQSLLVNDRFNHIIPHFQMRYNIFQARVAIAAQENAIFRRWRGEGAVDAIGQPAAPLPLVILKCFVLLVENGP